MKAYLEQTQLFATDEIAHFMSLGKKTTLKKGDFFIQEGETAKRFAFVETGVLRSFYYSSKSDEVTYCLSFPNELIAGYSSLITQTPTSENIQALMDCNIIEFPMQVINDLVSENTNWLLFSKQIAESQYIKLEKRVFLLQNENALTRYKELIENQSDYLQKIPLGYLASYLGISQRHLSRIRKQIAF